MMLKHYYEITAKNNFELGLALGQLFRRKTLARLARWRRKKSWKKQLATAQKLLPITKKYFPHLVKELRGYALSGKLKFEELWALCLEGEPEVAHCTTMITNNGKLIAHNEDYPSSKNDICLLKKTIGDLTIFEIFYYGTLGGNAASVNSHGWAHLVNSLFPKDVQNGIPRNIIARWLSETKNPEKDFRYLKKLRREDGYNHNFVNRNGKIINFECTPTRAVISQVESPFIHTNHYLTILKKYDNYKKESSYTRYDCAKKNLKARTTAAEIKKLMNDKSSGKINSIMNKETVGKIIFDMDKKRALTWFPCEQKRKFKKFELDFIK